MKGLDLLDALIEHYEQNLEIAQNEIQNNINWTGSAGKGWLKDKAVAEKNLKFLRAIKDGIMEDKQRLAVTGIYKMPETYKDPHPIELCCSRYRCMLFWDKETHQIDPIFWTPELGIDNSHRALVDYAIRNYRSIKGYCYLSFKYRWGGFYMYGRGNGDQEQLTLYGESSDYPHNDYSEKIKECFLKGIEFNPDNLEDDLPF